jgi:hypothetical protein
VLTRFGCITGVAAALLIMLVLVLIVEPALICCRNSESFPRRKSWSSALSEGYEKAESAIVPDCCINGFGKLKSVDPNAVEAPYKSQQQLSDP